jgi:hypothetical protein
LNLLMVKNIYAWVEKGNVVVTRGEKKTKFGQRTAPCDQGCR